MHEMIYLSPPVKEEIFRFFSLHGAQAETVVWRAPAGDASLLLLPEPPANLPVGQRDDGPVVDVKKRSEASNFSPGPDGSFFR